MSRSIAYTHKDRQWDGRFNIPNDEYLEKLKGTIINLPRKCNLKYFLISGIEIGDRPYQDDYKVRHVHMALIATNPISKASILKKLGIVEGYGYYLVPRNRDYTYAGWREHHVKPRTKEAQGELVLFEYGSLPVDKNPAIFTKRSEAEKKMSNREVLLEISSLLEEGKEEEAFKKYPRNYLMWGEKMKSRQAQKRQHNLMSSTDPHIWLYGFPGSGKTSLLQYIYPNSFKKNLDNKFFDLYDPTVHSHTILEDLDPNAVERLGAQFLKTICDRVGFPIDQKYKTPQLATTTVCVSSNYSITECFAYEEKGRDTTIRAIARRFYEVRCDNLLRFLGLKLISKYERNVLMASGNKDVSKLFIDWDYVLDQPTGYEIQDCEYYQEMIKNQYYGLALPVNKNKKLKLYEPSSQEIADALDIDGLADIEDSHDPDEYRKNQLELGS